MKEAAIARKRINKQLADETLLIKSAIMASLDKKADKEFRQNIKRLQGNGRKKE